MIGQQVTYLPGGMVFTVIDADPDMIPPSWMKIRDEETGEEHTIVGSDMDDYEVYWPHTTNVG